MNRERVLNTIDKRGVPRGILLSKQSEIRSSVPKFLSTLTQLEALILKASGLNKMEACDILMLSPGSVRNLISTLYNQNEKNYFEIISVASELELLSTIAVRGIERALKEKFGIKEHPEIINAMERAIKRKKIRQFHYTPLSIPLSEIREYAGRINQTRLFLPSGISMPALAQ
jgi:DNA-binding CsgD family transcriptional regulator